MQKGWKIEVYLAALTVFLVTFIIFCWKIELFLCPLMGILLDMNENAKRIGFCAFACIWV